jgi:ABC-2 type transport system permease protein
MTSVISVTLSLVREKERGTIEQLDVSPIITPELLLGKAFPYLILAFFNTALVLGTGYIFFGVVVKGSLFQLFITTLLFLSASIALGILVSVISDSQQIAFMIATMLSLLPSIILSGFIFPIEGMPVVIQILSNITPVKFYVIILRAIILRGVGWEAFYPQMIYLFLFFMFFMTLAMLAYYAKAKKA